MRIRLLTYSTRPRGGVVHTLALAEGLVRAGHTVEVWALSHGQDGRSGGDPGFFRTVDPRVALRLVPVPEIDGEGVGDRILRSMDLMAAALGSAGDVDVVHAQDCLTANAVGLASGYDGLLRTVHHLDRFTTPELAACHERALVEPSALVCVSSAVAAEVRAGWGRPATVIGNGVDAARFSAAATAGAGGPWRERFGRYVLSVGGIEPRKGTRDLVEAVALLPDLVEPDAEPGAAGPDAAEPDAAGPGAAGPGADRRRVRLVVAGGETLFDYRPYRAEVFARAEELGVVPDVLGPVDDDALPGLVAGAGAFAFPSTKEGFGLAAMEALAAGVPLVTRELPVLREVFGGAARFASDPAGFAAALAEALVDDDPRRRAAGQALAASHSWDTAAARHAELYARLAVRSAV